MQVKFQRLDEEVILPKYAKDGDAGFDIRSAENYVLSPGERKLFKTGFKMAIPKDHVGLIWDRSGLAAKSGVHTMAGVVDSGYRGEVGVVLRNTGNEDFEIKKNMRIAQMLLQQHLTAEMIEVKELEETERKEGGFGSSGNF